MKRAFGFLSIAGTVALLVAGSSAASAQTPPGGTADARAIAGAKAYMQAKGLTSLKLNMMMPSIFTAGSTLEMTIFEKETGIGVHYFEVGILQVQAKAMSEAVAKSGSFDFWIGDPISLPDLVEAGLARPIDDLVTRGKADLDDIVPGFQEQARYKGKTYGLVADGDNFILAIRKDLIDAPDERQKFKAKYGWEAGCPDTYEQWYQLAEFFTLHVRAALGGRRTLAVNSRLSMVTKPPALLCVFSRHTRRVEGKCTSRGRIARRNCSGAI